MSDGSIKFMTYNVWSCEHVAVYRRIQSISKIIEQHDPDVIFLQEVTHYIYSLFQEAPWWEKYTTKLASKEKYQKSSVSSNSNPASSFRLVLSKLDGGNVVLPEYCYFKSALRGASIPDDLLSAWVHTSGHRLRAATCRLASPTLSDIGSLHRRARTRAFLEHFDGVYQSSRHSQRRFVLDENVVLGGDLGWDDDLDGPLRLGGDGWVDAWQELRGGEAGGWTYDAVANPMLSLRALNLPVEPKRPDRFICKLKNFTVDSIKMIGVDAVPGVTRFDDKLGYPVPVLPSHHFGLLLTIKPKPN